MSASGNADRKRAARITAILRREYPDRAPLLHYNSPFQLLIAVILSAQTTDAQVNRISADLFARYPAAADLAAARRSEVEALVHSTGFFRSKARNIIGAARYLCEYHDGAVPQVMEDLVAIPGVGRKSANVIRGVVYGKPAIVVDTHLSRVVRRLKLAQATDPVRIERELIAALPESDQTDFSMAVNRHGRAVCTARAPRCPECVIAALCPSATSEAD